MYDISNFLKFASMLLLSALSWTTTAHAFIDFERILIMNNQNNVQLVAFYSALKQSGPFPAVILLQV